MERFIAQLIAVLFFAAALPVSADELATSPSPIGYWQTIDDISGKPKSIIQISENEHHALIGKVVKIYPKVGEDQHKVCVHCEGDKHDQPIVGMVVLYGLTLHDDQWKDGEILDPENGKTYRCSLRTADHGKKLNVHGYIGMPLLGRTQSWIRVNSAT